MNESADQLAVSIQRIQSLHQAVRIDYDGGVDPIYVGHAHPGTQPNAPGWRICKITWDDNRNPTIVQWAGGSGGYMNAWDDRVGLTYL